MYLDKKLRLYVYCFMFTFFNKLVYMTIDTGWLACFKEDATEAFTANLPIKPRAIFSDGQIRLMQSPPSEPQTWDQYIYKRFVCHYRDMLKSTSTLIIAFDNYEHVPAAKAMTQISRRKTVPPIPFSNVMPLPCMVPEGESWTQHISNRVFKVKVIELLVLRLPKLLLKLYPSKTIIIDYDTPCKYTSNEAGKVVCEEITDLTSMGEADVKFTRWADQFGRLLVDSIDGDSVPIALMHYELKTTQSAEPPQVAIYRYKIRLDKEQKRQRYKEYEYLHIPQLYHGLQDCIRQALGKMVLHAHQGHEIRMLISLITLTGTDFSRHLPQVSGKTVWDMLNSLWIPLAQAYDPSTQQLKPQVALSKLLCKIYQNKFSKHTPSCVTDLQQLLAHLQDSAKISARTKQSLPTYDQAVTTVKNCNWVMTYWKCQDTPDPISEEFGFVRVDNKVYYEDIAKSLSFT